MKKKLPLIIAFVVAIAAIAVTVIFLVTKLSGDEDNNDIEQAEKDNLTNVAKTDEDKESEEISYNYDFEEPDVKQYFEEKSEIISITPVKESPNTLSEKDAVDALKKRGFVTYPIITNYSFDGIYVDDVNVSDISEDKHPMYVTYYVTSKNELWLITIIDGSITATPSSYNINNPYNTPVIVSETKEISSYDGMTNSIYKTIPKENVVDVRIIDRIDSNTIDSLNLEGGNNVSK